MRSRLLRVGAVGVVVVVVGYFGINAVLNELRQRFNASIVFYDPGYRADIHPGIAERVSYPDSFGKEVENIILFIGDGMGVTHLRAASLHFRGKTGRLHIESMPVTGLVVNHSEDDIITDSGASATALATGFKTKNGRIGVDAQGTSRVTVLEAARDSGLATGLVTSTELTDATPAAFATHVPCRSMKSEIALQLVQSGINVLFGEGEDFYPRHVPRSKREDGANPIQLAQDLGYAFVDDKDDLRNANADYLLGLFTDITPDRMQVDLTQPARTPTLAQLTEKAIEMLSRNDKGFFLMVEEEGIDPGSHVNRPEYFLWRLRHFDEAVKVGLDFALQDERTLVIVTSDHETGGLNILDGADHELEFSWDTDRHTGQPSPLFAMGPQAMRFTGLKENTDIARIMAELLDLSL